MFRFTPTAGEQYRLKVTSPEGISKLPAMPLATAEQKIVFRAGSGVIEAVGKGITVTDKSSDPMTGSAGWIKRCTACPSRRFSGL